MIGSFLRKFIRGFVLLPSSCDDAEDSFRLELERRGVSPSDSEFLDVYYSEASPLAQQLALLVRDCLQKQLGVRNLRPHDCLLRNFPDIAFHELVVDLSEITKTRISQAEEAETIGTLHGLVSFFCRKQKIPFE